MDGKIRVLVVDDSAFARKAITRSLGECPDIDIVGDASDGEDAIAKVKSLRPDVVTLDVTMPKMDGLEALDHIMAECPTPVIMLSALTGEDTHTTIEALEKGAVDFYLKASVLSPTGNAEETNGLVEKIRIAQSIRETSLRAASKIMLIQRSRAPAKPKRTAVKNKVLVIGASTGGPKALAQLFPQIPADIPAAILVVQHMPAGFTTTLAERLNRNSQIDVKEAEAGDLVTYGKALLAPGGFHMVVNDKGRIVLNEDPTVCGVRPAVNVTMESVAKVYGKSSLGVVMTGMGSDGTDGAKAIKMIGGRIAVEDESSCAVYGMPKSVVEAGLADSVVPLSRLAEKIVEMCEQ